MSNAITKSLDNRLTGFDIVRIVATVSVFWVHYDFYLPRPNNPFVYGLMDVFLEAFFVMSGYLISNQLFGNYVKNGSVSLRNFFIRRAFRSLPIYFAAVAVAVIPRLFLNFGPLPSLWPFLTFTQTFMPFESTMLTQTWSICIEEHFYLILPFAFLLVRKHCTLKRVVTATIGVLILEALLRGIWYHAVEISNFARNTQDFFYFKFFDKGAVPYVKPHGVYLEFVKRNTFLDLDGVLLGTILGACRCFKPDIWSKLMKNGARAGLYACLFLSFAYFQMALISLDSISWSSASLSITMASIGFALFTIFLLSDHPIANSIKQMKIPGLALVGDFTFAFYLVHMDLIFFVGKFISRSSPLRLPVTLAVCLLVSLVLYFLVQRPACRLRERFIIQRHQTPLDRAA
jgi:peptidoglycan/LPS O-acetylase OafA/YrhL